MWNVEFLQIIGSIFRYLGAGVFVAFFFGMCVFVHELGHFLVAKWRGLHIVAFSIGFRKAWGKKINGVEYRIGWIPAGGYVDLPQIDTTNTPVDDDGNELPVAKPMDRLLTAAAGPLANIIFGMLLGCVVWVFGIPSDTAKFSSFTIDGVVVESPEYEAGLRPGDVVTHLNGNSFHFAWNDFTREIMFTIGDVRLGILRDGERHEISYTPVPNPYVAPELRRERLAWPFFWPRHSVLITPTDSRSPAAQGGVMNGDELLSVNGVAVTSFMDMKEAIDNADGAPVDLEIRRGAEVVTVTVTPEKNPSSQWLHLAGIKHIVPTKGDAAGSVAVAELLSGFPAEQAGILPGDIVMAINGVAVTELSDFTGTITSGDSPDYLLSIKRGDELLDIVVAPRVLGRFNIGVRNGIHIHPSPWAQFTSVVDMTYRAIRNIGVNLGNKVNLTDQTSSISAKHLGGPVQIVVLMFKSAYTSIIHGFYVVVLISFALALANLLPLPVLDGGHIVFALIEMICGRPVPKVIVKHLSMFFVVLLFGAMGAVTLMDINRLRAAPPLPDTTLHVITIYQPEPTEFRGDVLP